MHVYVSITINTSNKAAETDMYPDFLHPKFHTNNNHRQKSNYFINYITWKSTGAPTRISFFMCHVSIFKELLDMPFPMLTN